MNLEIYNSALKIIKKLQDNGFSAYIVGGTVRDILLANSDKHITSSNDIDIATSATPLQINHLFEKTYNIGAAFGIVNVIENGVPFEVATFRKETGYNDGRRPNTVIYTDNPEEDAMRRDFTINALFYNPFNDEILDFVGGHEDLKKGILRTIGNAEARFSEDYLRILRAIRFGIRFDLKIDTQIISAINKLSLNLSKLSNERIRDELNKIFSGPKPEKALRMLSKTGILKVIIPELEAMKGIPQPKKFHPEGDVFEHTALMLKHMAIPSEELVWTILLHDVGKPLTFSIDENNIERFILHAEKGAELAEKILRRLRFSRSLIMHVCFAIKNHMRYASVKEMRIAKVKRLIAEPTFPLELELHRLDCLSSHRKMDNFVFILDTIFEQKNEIKLPPPLLTGKDLIEFGIPQGPIYGKILLKIEELQIEKILKTKEDALNWLKGKYKK